MILSYDMNQWCMWSLCINCILFFLKACTLYVVRSTQAWLWTRPVGKPPWIVCLAEMKWNESGCRPPMCTYRLSWARRTSSGWWDDWDDTVLQTQDSKFEPWRSEVEHATSRSRRLPIIWLSHVDGEETFFVSFKPIPGTGPRTLAWKAAVLITTLGPPPTLSGKRQCKPSEEILPLHTLVNLASFCFRTARLIN